MPKKQIMGSSESTKYYGIVEDVIEAIPDNQYSRSILLIDSVRSDLFERDGFQVIENRQALTLVRAMSTPARWRSEFDLGNVQGGDWLSFELDDSGGVPRAWELPAANNYVAERARSIKTMRRISGDGALVQPGDAGLVARLTAAAKLPLQNRPRLGAIDAIQRLGSGGGIEIIALDVGQASAAIIKKDKKTIGFFDIGAPIWFNNRSFPRKFLPPIVNNGFVILSHWDFDHFDLARRYGAYRNLDWFAPDQLVGLNTARFQMDLGDKLNFIDGTYSDGGFALSRGMSKIEKDRNGTGYQLRYEEGAKAVILTGDAAYDLIEAPMLADICALTVPHHGGLSEAIPPLAKNPKLAVASYGEPNRYRHPHNKTVENHENKRWNFVSTAKTRTKERGNRKLFP